LKNPPTSETGRLITNLRRYGGDLMRLFLGGSCDPTTWRADIAIPLLEKAGVSYYNPQVPVWSPELVTTEATAKDEAEALLFVIAGRTRAIVSMVEATEYMCTGRPVWLVVEDIPNGTVIAGKLITDRELRDLNNAREYLRDVARRNHVDVYSDVETAVRDFIRRG
jgi:hypothetical protein